MQTFFDAEGRAWAATILSALPKQSQLVQVFKEGDLVQVTGISKGKGFAGGVKRHGFAGGPRTHGQSDRERAPGATGSTTTPGRVLAGKRMAGRLGGGKVTIKNLRVLKVDAENNQIFVSGPVPGVAKRQIILKKIEERK